MKKRESVAVALAMLTPLLLLGGGFAMASDAVQESPPVDGFSERYDQPLDPVPDVENQDSQDTAVAAGDSNSDSVVPTEEPCPSCDVILLNEYPELHYR